MAVGFSTGPRFEAANPYTEEDRGPELFALHQAQQQQRQEAPACEMSLTSLPGSSSARFHKWFTRGEEKGEWFKNLNYGVFDLGNRQDEHFNKVAVVVDEILAVQAR
ncbi:hypothetical protein DVH24_009619 [Malus domestica]|uniref:Uncharacterized protein n=1 Tax=Malus domestica TaxID=3750 RepID=A0A498JPE7_MALDO|nr:hypothetical protein DVH24_009619 [Malus domestica]